MKDNIQDRKELFNNVKFAMLDSGFVKLKEVEHEGDFGFHCGVEFEFFSCIVFVAIQNDQQIIKVNLIFFPPVDRDNVAMMEELIGRINSSIMDIGTFLIIPDGVVSLRTDIPIEGEQGLLIEQFRDMLDRLLHHGSTFYRWILITEELGLSPEQSMMHFASLNGYEFCK